MTPHLSFTKKHWVSKPDASKPRSADELLRFLQESRGLTDMSASLIDPSVFPDCERATERIRTAMEHKETIAIFGDYDCDGITAAAILARFFRRHGIEPHVRLPHRVHDGYGVSATVVHELKTNAATLLITVDTGIAAVREIAELQAAGIDVIVTDHHHAQETLPPAFAIIHPALAPGYPVPHPCGAGVALALVRALEGNRWDDMETDIALAAIGTVADLVPLLGDNRRLVQSGLGCLSRITEGPLALLVEQAGIVPTEITSGDIAFRIAPRINAAGRMADPTIALEALLMGGDALTMLGDLNRQRQLDTETLLAKALASLPFDPTDPLGPPLLATAGAEYPHGIIGLLAGKLTELSGKPSLVATIEGDHCTASLRSPSAYHITEGLTRCSALLSRFGGHAQAAGCSFPLAQWNTLVDALASDVTMHATDNLVPRISIDAHLTPEHLTARFCTMLQSLEPHGQGNMQPRFLLSNVRMEHMRTVGKEGDHLQARIHGHKAIGFRLGTWMSHARDPVDIVCRLELDTWNGNNAAQIVIEDIGATSERMVLSEL